MNNTIISIQLFFIIFQTQVGVGVLSLPVFHYAGAGKDGWITLIIIGVEIQVIIYIFYLLSNRFPSSTIYEYAPKIVGEYVGFEVIPDLKRKRKHYEK